MKNNMKNEERREHEVFNKKRVSIRKMNKALIEKWRAEERPWWMFWSHTISFEEKRDIIIRNWESIKE